MCAPREMLLHHPMISGRQIRTARALVNWSQQMLADTAIVSLNAVHQLEIGMTDPKASTVSAIRKALEGAGVEFIPAERGKGEGVRLASADL